MQSYKNRYKLKNFKTQTRSANIVKKKTTYIIVKLNMQNNKFRAAQTLR